MRAHLKLNRLKQNNESGMALLTAIFLIMVVAALSVLVLGVVTAQVKPTIVAAKNSRTITAAEAGVDAALSQIRNAEKYDEITKQWLGAPEQLPCTVDGYLDGSDVYGYKVAITYFDDDPRGRDDQWRADNTMTCDGTGGLTVAPAHAVISSEGVDHAIANAAVGTADRTIETAYTFQLINNNIDGGAIYSFGLGYCIEAEGQVAGSTIKYVGAENCHADDPRRMWTWDTDYGIHLSVTNLTGATKLCITGRPGSNGTPVDATLQVCSASNSKQLFSWHAGARWRVQNENNTNYSPYCLGTGAFDNTLESGRKVMVGNCTDNQGWSSWDPDARVGAGKASKQTSQIVNFLEFGRCADVTQANINNDTMIVYPCKQDPSGTDLLEWNHEWFYNEPTGFEGARASEISVHFEKNSGNRYCLNTGPSGSTTKVTFQKNCGNADTKWTRTADTGVWADSWQFVDRYGRCLSLGTTWVNGTENWSSMVATTCTGEPAQKWNAPPNGQAASLDNFKELVGSGS